MSNEYRHVDPLDIILENPETYTPLTEEETDIQIQDSFRTGRQFIKTNADPIMPNPFKTYQTALLQAVGITGQDDLPVPELPARPLEAVCFHLFKKPFKYTTSNGKEYIHYGWFKSRGEHPNKTQAENEIRTIMQDVDTYTITSLYEKGVFAPITTQSFSDDAVLEQMYEADMKREDERKDAFVEAERRKEQALWELKTQAEPGSLEDYVKKKTAVCAAEVRITKAKELIATLQPKMNKKKKQVEDMEFRNPAYYDDGLILYREKMKEVGYPEPDDYYSGVSIGI